jgi:hypothetical protein
LGSKRLVASGLSDKVIEKYRSLVKEKLGVSDSKRVADLVCKDLNELEGRKRGLL